MRGLNDSTDSRVVLLCKAAYRTVTGMLTFRVIIVCKLLSFNGHVISLLALFLSLWTNRVCALSNRPASWRRGRFEGALNPLLVHPH